jgi:hypothetical protein
MLPAASRKHYDAVALYRVQDVVLNFCGDKKRLDRDSISLQSLEAISANDDRRECQGKYPLHESDAILRVGVEIG